MALHLYSHEHANDGSALVMRCGAVSRMPEQSAPYVDTSRAFLGFPQHERCAACMSALAPMTDG